uniref:RNA-directed DNA polymerase n=3 Tax=Lygus hesperus TaxID=30085 RepID=A0A0A9W9U6_LYGHE
MFNAVAVPSGVQTPSMAPEPYDFASDFTKWLKRFDRYRMVVGLHAKPGEEQVNALIYYMGARAEEVYSSFSLTADQQNDYNHVCERFTHHFSPKINIIYERAKFNRRFQGENEPVEEFITALYTLSAKCNYGVLRDDLIRDQIVVGVKDRALSDKLVQDFELTLEKAITFSRQYEDLKKQKAFLGEKPETSTRSVEKIDKRQKYYPGHHENYPQRNSDQPKGTCWRCGQTPYHSKYKCSALKTRCSRCGFWGHFPDLCQSTRTRSPETYKQRSSETAHQKYKIKGKNVRQVDTSEQSCYSNDSNHSSDDFIGAVHDVRVHDENKWHIKLKINGRPYVCKIDSGADVTCLPASTINVADKVFAPDTKLLGAGQRSLEVVGMQKAEMQYLKETIWEDVYYVDGLKSPLLGKPAIEKLNLFKRVNLVSDESSMWIESYPELFTGLGRIREKYKIELTANAKPYAITAPRRISIPLRDATKMELDRMVQRGVIEKVDKATDWCAPVVIVPKKSGAVRICVDLSELNRNVKRQVHPLPKVDYELGLLSGAKFFTKLDANNGFWQVELEEESRDLTTFLTPFGRFRFLRLPFGISSAPEYYQKKISNLLEGKKNAINHMDDILVWGSTQEEHDTCLKKVLDTLRNEGITLNKEKSVICVRSVNFLGNVITETGVTPDPERIRAIVALQEPKDLTELRRYVGTIGFILKFIPNSANLMKPLFDLMSTKHDFVWGPLQQKCFNKIKTILSKDNSLALYDPKKPITLSCDASQKGLGAVLLQPCPVSGNLRPVYYCSRTLQPAEKHYANIEREALAIAWACQRLEEFVLGKNITIETDHKPLLQLLQTTHLTELSPRLQRLRIRLMRYSYSLVYTPGKMMISADCLSRDPLQETGSDELPEDIEAYVQVVVEGAPISDLRVKKIMNAQEEDIYTQIVKDRVINGWELPINDPKLRQYYHVRDEMSVWNGILLRGQRFVIPEALRKEMLSEIHNGHLGITKCQHRARQSVWWPKMSADIESHCMACPICWKMRQNPKEPLLPTSLPERPWHTVSMDLFKCESRWFIVITDTYSRYFEIATLQNLTSAEIIEKCKSTFSRHGIPVVVRTDGGSQFQELENSEFRRFADTYGFRHLTSSPYFPQSNGAAEAAVKIAKTLLKKNEDPYLALLIYRNTPLPGLEHSPAELLMGRRLRDTVPTHPALLRGKQDDEFPARDHLRRQTYKLNFDNRHRSHALKELDPGDKVWIPDLQKEGTVRSKAEEPRSYWVEPQGSGRQLRRNRQSLVPERKEPQLQTPFPPASRTLPRDSTPSTPQHKSIEPPLLSTPEEQTSASARPLGANHGEADSERPRTTRSGRPIVAPKRLNL